MTIKTIRNALRVKFGARRYRITRTGDIHVFGVMPSTNVVGWYLYGYVGDASTEARITG